MKWYIDLMQQIKKREKNRKREFVDNYVFYEIYARFMVLI